MDDVIDAMVNAQENAQEMKDVQTHTQGSEEQPELDDFVTPGDLPEGLDFGDPDEYFTVDELIEKLEDGEELPSSHPLQKLDGDDFVTNRVIDAIQDYENSPARRRQEANEQFDQVFGG